MGISDTKVRLHDADGRPIEGASSGGSVSLPVDSNVGSVIMVATINPTVTGARNWQYVDEGESFLEVDKSTVTVTEANFGSVAYRFAVPDGEAIDEDLSGFNFTLGSGDVLMVAGY